MSSKFTYPHKLFDTERAPTGGRIDAKWLGQKFAAIFHDERNAPKLPASFRRNIISQSYVLSYFNLRAFEYGNWLSQEDRWQYYLGNAASLLDLARLAKIDASQIGLGGLVSIAFGARGKGSALAHFEPWNYAINLTRYRREAEGWDDLKFLKGGGGVGSLGHEWAHALDHYLSAHNGEGAEAMSSDLIHKHLPPAGSFYYLQSKPKKKADRLFFDLMLQIMFAPTEESGKYQKSRFYSELIELVSSGPKGDYWTRPHEIFARSFETYLHHEGKRRNIHNPFLHKDKYTSKVYPSDEDYNAFRKPMKALLDFAAANLPLSAIPTGQTLKSEENDTV